MKISKLQPTSHAVMRLAQRGFRKDDAEWIMTLGTEVEGGYLVLKKDVFEIERLCKRLPNELRRLVGARIVVDGGVLITAYHAKPRKQRKLLSNQ
ncbi:MAG: DUF4258 domain-containing protein [Rhodobacteraceae bacterium]|nr:DUF4258 domain-containing protein [Paracoccaceae bacterium]